MASGRNLNALVAIAAALAAGGCVQRGASFDDRAPPAEPMVLTAPVAGGAQATPSAPALSSSAAQPLPVTALAPAGDAGPVSAVPPAQSVAQQMVPPPARDVAGGADARRTPYPNINELPPEPGGELLSRAERTRIINELEALRARQKRTAPSSVDSAAAELRQAAETHGADAIRRIEQCSTPEAASDPGCRPPAE